jgi:hypothetical protein
MLVDSVGSVVVDSGLGAVSPGAGRRQDAWGDAMERLGRLSR